MKKLISILFCLITLISFAACNDSEDKPVAKKQDYEVTFEFNEEKSTGGRICVDTSLPVGTLLDVDVFVGDKYHSTETVEVVTDISSNYFITETHRDADGNDIEDGNYILSFELVEMTKQPTTVKELLGTKGELMKGNDVYMDETGEGKIVKFTRPVLKKNGKFTMSDGME